jgi:hypothetical protein
MALVINVVLAAAPLPTYHHPSTTAELLATF